MSETNILNMDFKELRDEVQLLRDELAIMQRKYEDILYNLDYENFSGNLIKEKDNMKTRISQTESNITAQAERIDNNSSEIATLELTASGISSSVKEVQDGISTMKTSISQTSDSITQIVKASYSSPKTLDELPTDLDELNKRYLYYIESSNYYYFWNGDKWERTTRANFGTVFTQTATGFKLNGNVSISGNLITSGTITGTDIKGTTITSGEITTGEKMYGDGLRIYGGTSPCIEICWNGISVGKIGLGSFGMYISNSGGEPIVIKNVKATGNWDFSEADVKWE